MSHSRQRQGDADLDLDPPKMPAGQGRKAGAMVVRRGDLLLPVWAGGRAGRRSRLANFAELDARRRSGLLRGLMFLHMKAGLDADIRRLRFSQETYDLHRTQLSPSGVRKDFQQALAELRTDLDAFTPDEACGLMACGYQMASKALDRDLPKLEGLWRGSPLGDWPFKDMHEEITSTDNSTPGRDSRLKALRAGHKVTIADRGTG
jgi:hypothetical protein